MSLATPKPSRACMTCGRQLALPSLRCACCGPTAGTTKAPHLLRPGGRNRGAGGARSWWRNVLAVDETDVAARGREKLRELFALRNAGVISPQELTRRRLEVHGVMLPRRTWRWWRR